MREKNSRLKHISRSRLFGHVFLGSIIAAGIVGRQIYENFPHVFPRSVERMYPSRLEERLTQLKQKNDDHTSRERYALIVSGEQEDRFLANASIAYRTLIENGVLPEHMFVLTFDGNENYYVPVDDVANRMSIGMVMDYFSDVVDRNDSLFVQFSDHGRRDSYTFSDDTSKAKYISSFKVRNSKIASYEIDRDLSRLQPREGLLVVGACNSGGICEDISNEDFICISSGRENEKSHSSLNGSFPGDFMEAFTYNKKRNADSDKDGRVSVLEAYEFARENHRWTKNGTERPELFFKRVDPAQIYLKE